MHIIIGVLGVLGALVFWYYRLKYLGQAANEMVDTAGKMRGAYNRRKFRNKVEGSPLTAIDDPQTAASVMAVAVMEEKGPLSRETEDILRRELRNSIDVQDPEEMVTFTKWVVQQTADPDNVSRRFAKMWLNGLSETERRTFLAMVQRLAGVDGEATVSQHAIISRLQERLAL